MRVVLVKNNFLCKELFPVQIPGEDVRVVLDPELMQPEVQGLVSVLAEVQASV